MIHNLRTFTNFPVFANRWSGQPPNIALSLRFIRVRNVNTLEWLNIRNSFCRGQLGKQNVPRGTSISQFKYDKLFIPIF